MTNQIFNKILFLEREKGKEGPRKVRKFRKRKKNFSCYVKRLSNKYRKNSKIDKFNIILDLQAEKAKKGLEKSANFAKIAKVKYPCQKRQGNKYRTDNKLAKFQSQKEKRLNLLNLRPS